MLWSFNRWGFPWFPSADFAGQTTAEPLWRCEGSYEPRKGGHFHGGWPWADVLVLKLSVSGNIYMKTWFFNTGVSCRCSLHLILGFFDMLCLCYPLAMKIGRNGELLFAHFPRFFSQPQPALPWDLLPSAMLIIGPPQCGRHWVRRSMSASGAARCDNNKEDFAPHVVGGTGSGLRIGWVSINALNIFKC